LTDVTTNSIRTVDDRRQKHLARHGLPREDDPCVGECGKSSSLPGQAPPRRSRREPSRAPRRTPLLKAPGPSEAHRFGLTLRLGNQSTEAMTVDSLWINPQHMTGRIPHIAPKVGGWFRASAEAPGFVGPDHDFYAVSGLKIGYQLDWSVEHIEPRARSVAGSRSGHRLHTTGLHRIRRGL
jgi:hypothetical protein